MRHDASKSRTAWMTQASVPEVDGDLKTDGRRRGGGAQGVEVAGALTAEENRLAVKILYGETKGIKFNRDRIISG